MNIEIFKEKKWLVFGLLIIIIVFIGVMIFVFRDAGQDTEQVEVQKLPLTSEEITTELENMNKKDEQEEENARLAEDIEEKLEEIILTTEELDKTRKAEEITKELEKMLQ